MHSDPERVVVGDIVQRLTSLRREAVRAGVNVVVIGEADTFALHGFHDGDIPFSKRVFATCSHACEAETEGTPPDKCIEALGCSACSSVVPTDPATVGTMLRFGTRGAR